MFPGSSGSSVRALAMAAACALALPATGAMAQASDDNFYAGKTIRVIVGTAAGGGFSTYALLLSAHMPKHIPGSPRMVVEHMPGAGGINSLNYAAVAGPKDGTAFTIVMPNFYLTPHTEPQAVRFDPREFRFLGRMSDFGRVLVTWHGTGIRNIEDLKAKPVVVGASSRASTTYVGPALVNEFLGTKMNIITGYRGTGPTLVAMESGEVGATTVAWTTLQSLRADWLRDNKVHVIASMDGIPAPVDGVPRMRDLIEDPAQRELFDFIHLFAVFGTAAATPPGVPAERVAILREAFDATIKDADFLAEAKKRNLPINPMPGQELDEMFTRDGVPSKELAERAARAMGVNK